MNVNLPDDTVAFDAVLRQCLHDLRRANSETPALYAALLALGALDLATDEAADPHNAQLNTVVAVEACAHAGVRAPFADTIWVRSQGLVSLDGFVALPSDVFLNGERLVPCAAASVGVATVDAAGRVAVGPLPHGSRPAVIDVDDGHVWVPLSAPPGAARSLATADPAFAWRVAAALTVGAMSAATEMATEHARTRTQFGKPIGSFQALQFRLAECQWRLLGLRLLVREAAWRADRADDCADVVAALAWLYAREVGRVVTRHTHQVFGAIGFTRELGLATHTGAAATCRAVLPARAAAQLVRARRGWEGADPPSTVLGGFATAAPVAPAAGAAR